MPVTTQLPRQRALRGVRIVSLALNLPGPAALMRCRAMGATCVKVEPPPPVGSVPGTTADPMGVYNRAAYDTMHQGVRVLTADLKTEVGQKALHRELAKTDVLLTSFRPSALAKLGLQWSALRKQYPQLSLVEIVGAPGVRAEEPGHDLTYMAESGLVTGTELPPTLYADMGGSLMASEAVLQARLLQLSKGKGVCLEIALSEAANYLALPRAWGLTTRGAAVGGGHAGYRVFPCKDGRVALAALEPHFAAVLAKEVGLPKSNIMAMFMPDSHTAVAQWCAQRSCAELEAIGTARDIPLYTLPTA
ncbi:CoA transferase [Curvibacter sp. APW13]|uniref:CoA transferase n=1 Tax=Curvibacter sp. APW13 TaxID=3077236 RepID=UPI0028DD4DC2|nr:CoA transferase [Curvibacter sp. APW13]MDT8991671.1 CoA transferase [Curvibacter sp. APW13]